MSRQHGGTGLNPAPPFIDWEGAINYGKLNYETIMKRQSQNDDARKTPQLTRSTSHDRYS